MMIKTLCEKALSHNNNNKDFTLEITEIQKEIKKTKYPVPIEPVILLFKEAEKRRLTGVLWKLPDCLLLLAHRPNDELKTYLLTLMFTYPDEQFLLSSVYYYLIQYGVTPPPRPIKTDGVRFALDYSSQPEFKTLWLHQDRVDAIYLGLLLATVLPSQLAVFLYPHCSDLTEALKLAFPGDDKPYLSVLFTTHEEHIRAMFVWYGLKLDRKKYLGHFLNFTM